MTAINLTVNGRPTTAEVAPRTHLADVLREQLLLTGTHLGCEHGVCGACTVLLDGEPARSCLAYAAACDRADIRTVEGLEDDPAAIRLRAAFSAHHALQCGYCTPGMLVTARDIVHRLPDATDDEVRLELAGNLCRCTGYNGIVRAIRQVLDERLAIPAAVRPAIPAVQFADASAAAAPPSAIPPERARPGRQAQPGQGLHQRLRFEIEPAALWQAVRNPATMVSCIPGATLGSVDGDTVAGEMLVSLGPVRARFRGEATIRYDDAERTGTIAGGGADTASGTRLTATAPFRVEPEPQGAVLVVDLEYALRGPLSQLAKGRVVDLLADEIAGQFAANLRARLAGQTAPVQAPLSALRLLLRVAGRWLRGRIGRG